MRNDMLVFYGCEADYHGGQWCKSQSDIEGPSTRLTDVRGWEDVSAEARKQTPFLCFLPALMDCLVPVCPHWG